jgi:hypothetical protein
MKCMRYSYGILDQRRILLYQPQLFLRGDDILVFPSKDFQKWHGNIKEYIDSLHQINSLNQSINMEELNLASGVLYHITEELENLFNHLKTSENSYQYIPALDKSYRKRQKNTYSSDMRRCDIRIPVKQEITPALKYQNMMEIVEYVNWRFSVALKGFQTYKFRNQE